MTLLLQSLGLRLPCQLTLLTLEPIRLLVVKLPDGQELSHVSKVVFDHWSEARRLGLLDPRNRVHPFSVIQAKPLQDPAAQRVGAGTRDPPAARFGRVHIASPLARYQPMDSKPLDDLCKRRGRRGQRLYFGKIRKLKRTSKSVCCVGASVQYQSFARTGSSRGKFFRSDWLNLDSGKKLPESTKNGVVLALDAWGPSRSIAALIAGLRPNCVEYLQDF